MARKALRGTLPYDPKSAKRAGLNPAPMSGYLCDVRPSSPLNLSFPTCRWAGVEKSAQNDCSTVTCLVTDSRIPHQHYICSTHTHACPPAHERIRCGTQLCPAGHSSEKMGGLPKVNSGSVRFQPSGQGFLSTSCPPPGIQSRSSYCSFHGRQMSHQPPATGPLPPNPRMAHPACLTH